MIYKVTSFRSKRGTISRSDWSGNADCTSFDPKWLLSRLTRGSTDNIAAILESMKPSVTTKYCFICSTLYALMPSDLIYILITGLLITMKTGPLFSLPVDVFKSVEDKVCPILFEKKVEATKKD